MSFIELCVEVDVVGASALNVKNSLLSCGNNIAANESTVQRFVTNLDEDSGDDDYMISNSYVEDSLDEEEDIDDIFYTDEEVANMIQPLTIMQPREGGSETTFWESASNYNNINWSHPDEEDICGFDMASTFNIGQELFFGMEFESKKAVKNALQQKAWKAKQKAIMIEYGDWDESYGQLSSWLKHMQNHCPRSYYQICDDDFVVGNTRTMFEVEEAFDPIYQRGNEDSIPPSDESWTLVPDPSFIRMKGRPRSTRLRNEMDWREPSQTRQKCGRCGVQGHNRRNCPLQSNQGSC
ncbi:hypothetical protein GmHk_10G028583 [Glycine max]|nr:hypothetical protein GmHk_10G028583 [Glycine max]